MSKLQRELIGRAALAVMGLALLWGAYKCFRAAADIQADIRQHYAESGGSPTRGIARGTGLPVLIGVALAFFGIPFTVAAVVPVSLFARLMGRQRHVTLGEGHDATAFRHLRDFQ